MRPLRPEEDQTPMAKSENGAHHMVGMKQPRTHGTGRQPCNHRKCPWRSVPGLHKGEGKCPYHWAVGCWGRAYADSIYQGAPSNEE